MQQTGILFALRWHGARSGFEGLRDNSHRATAPVWVGTFQVRSIRYVNGEAWYELGFPDLYSKGSPDIVHSPEGLPKRHLPSHHLGGDWYAVLNPT